MCTDEHKSQISINNGIGTRTRNCYSVTENEVACAGVAVKDNATIYRITSYLAFGYFGKVKMDKNKIEGFPFPAKNHPRTSKLVFTPNNDQSVLCHMQIR